MEVHVVARRAVRRRLGVGERAEGRARALAHARGEAAGVEHARDVDETALDVRVLVQNVNVKLGVDLQLSIVFEYATPAELA